MKTKTKNKTVVEDLKAEFGPDAVDKMKKRALVETRKRDITQKKHKHFMSKLARTFLVNTYDKTGELWKIIWNDTKSIPAEAVMMIKKVKNPLPIKKFHRVAAKYFHIKDSIYIDITYGAVAANLCLDSDPVWLGLIGPPGCGKTDVIESMVHKDFIRKVSQLTRNTLVSGLKGKKSLLPDLDGKIMAIEDISPLLSTHRDAAREIFGQLRSMYTGHYVADYGSGVKNLEIWSKFGFVFGVTEIIDIHKRMLGPLGERFLFCRFPFLSTDDRLKMGRKAQRLSKIGQAKKKLTLSKLGNKIINDLVRYRDKKKKIPELTEQQHEKLVLVADLISRLRTHILRDRYTHDPAYDIQPETPTRLVQNLESIIQGVAVLYRRPRISKYAMKCGYKTAVDCLTGYNQKLVKFLIEKYPKGASIKDIHEHFGVVNKTAKDWLEDLFINKITLKKQTPNFDKYGPKTITTYEIDPIYIKLMKELF